MILPNMKNSLLERQFKAYDTAFTQQQMQCYLDSVYYQQGIEQVLEELFEWSLQTGYLTQGKLYDNPLYQYPDPESPIEYRTQINIARSKYSPAPQTGTNIPTLHCPICFENIGIPGKENLRAFTFELTEDREFFVQFTPFPIFPYHAVIIDKHINPMIMEEQSVIDLLAFLNKAPHYVMLSNSDVVGAGASIISHHNYQAVKNLTLPIMHATLLHNCQQRFAHHSGHTQVGLLDYPIACVRVASSNQAHLIQLSGALIRYWKSQDPGKNTCNLLLHKIFFIIKK